MGLMDYLNNRFDSDHDGTILDDTARGLMGAHNAVGRTVISTAGKMLGAEDASDALVLQDTSETLAEDFGDLTADMFGERRSYDPEACTDADYGAGGQSVYRQIFDEDPAPRAPDPSRERF